MKYSNFNNKIMDIENKIIIACLGIAVITILFYFINKSAASNYEGMIGAAAVFGSEGPLDITGTVATYAAADALLTQVIVQENNDINSMITDMLIETSAAITDEEVAATAALTDEIVIAEAKEVEAVEMKEATTSRWKDFVGDRGQMISDKAQKVATVVGTAANISATQAQNVVANAQNIKNNFRQADLSKKTGGMFSNLWTVGLLGFLASSVIGGWVISNIEVLIYRITNFKSCFVWYFLEIIGWILYLPIEFIVWLFCLQEFEKTSWKYLDKLDCAINSATGYYLFKHSDEVNKKCYSKVFSSFPSLSIPFNFDYIGNFLNEMGDQANNLTADYGTMDDVEANVEQAAQDASHAEQTARDAEIASEAMQATALAADLAAAMIP